MSSNKKRIKNQPGNRSCKDVKIVIGSVRAAHYTGPLDGAASSFYDMYNKLAEKWDNQVLRTKNGCCRLHFGYFNAVPSDQRPRADLKLLREADVFLIVVENEFQYAMNKINPVYRQYLDDRLEKIRGELEGKTVIVLNSDIQHSPELIWNYTLDKVPLKAMHWISENDLPGNYHTMKYHNLSHLLGNKNINNNHYRNNHNQNRKGDKTYDFAYWGSYRDDSPERQEVLTGLKKEYPQITTFYLGHLPPFTDQKWTRKFIEAVPTLTQARSTICFGVDDNPDWLTAKYHEAMGMHIIPFVWSNYDVNGELGEIPWQRVDTLDELAKKIYEIRDPKRWNSYWTQIERSYLSRIKSESEILDFWEESLLPMISC